MEPQPCQNQRNFFLDSRAVTVGLIVIVASLMRLLPHSPNFTPILAMALFTGAKIKSTRLAIGLPLMAMIVSDFFLGFHNLVPLVYGCIALISWLGSGLEHPYHHRGWLPKFWQGSLTILASSSLFFVITNFGVWAASGMYQLSLVGLVQCYVEAIPFFHNMLISTCVYSVLFFSGFALAETILKKWQVIFSAR